MVVQEVYNDWISRRRSAQNGIFYYILLQEKDTHIRYIKLGISFRGISRFKDKDYKIKYSFIKPLYMVELDDPNEVYDLEDLNRVILRNMKGLTFVEKDRFKYFQVPKNLPLCKKFNEYCEITVDK